MSPPVKVEAGAPDVDILGREALVPSPEDTRTGRHARPRRWLGWGAVAVVAALVQAGLGRRDVLNPGGWALFRRFFAAAADPELAPAFLRLTWDAALTTLSYAVLGTALSVVVGVVGGVLASETWWGRGAARRRDRAGRGGWLAARCGLGLPRGVHEAVWGLFLINVLGLDPLVGVLAIGIPYGAVTAKVFSELLDDTPGEPYRALRAAGAGRLSSLGYGLLPSAWPDMLSYAFYRFECSIRAAAILGIIGAGGLGFQLALSFQSLRYAEMWTLLYALVLLSGLADAWSSVVRRRLAAGTPSSSGMARPRRDRILTRSACAAVALVVVAAWQLRIDLSPLWSARSWRLFGDIVSASVPLELPEGGVGTLVRLAVETVGMSIVAMALAWLAAVAVAILAARGGSGSGVVAAVASRLARAFLLLCRAIPPPVWAFVLLLVLFPGPLPGALALAVYNFGILGRLMAEVVENLDPRPAAALVAGGASRAQAFLYGVLPGALPRFAAYGIYRWEVTIRETVVVGLVGAGGLGTLLTDQLAAFDYAAALTTVGVLILLTVAVDLIGSGVRRSLR